MADIIDLSGYRDERNSAAAEVIREVLEDHLWTAMQELPNAKSSDFAIGLCEQVANYIVNAYHPVEWSPNSKVLGKLVIDLVSDEFRRESGLDLRTPD